MPAWRMTICMRTVVGLRSVLFCTVLRYNTVDMMTNTADSLHTIPRCYQLLVSRIRLYYSLRGMELNTCATNSSNIYVYNAVCRHTTTTITTSTNDVLL